MVMSCGWAVHVTEFCVQLNMTPVLTLGKLHATESGNIHGEVHVPINQQGTPLPSSPTVPDRDHYILHKGKLSSP